MRTFLSLPAVIAVFGTLAFSQAPPVARVIGSHALPVMAVAVSPDERTIASASGTAHDGVLVGQVLLWDATTGARVGELTGRGGVFYSLAYSPDGGLLAAGNSAGTTTVWDVRTGAVRHDFRGHIGPVRGLAFAPDGRTLATSGIRSDEVQLWDPNSGASLAAIKAHSGGIMALAWSRAGLLATVGRDLTLKVWSSTRQLASTIQGLRERTLTVTFAGDGTTLMIGGAGVTVVDLTTGKVQTIDGFQNTVSSMLFTPDGQTLITATGAAEIMNGGRAMIMGYPEFQVTPQAASDTAAGTSRAGIIRAHNAKTGELVGELSALTDFIWSVAHLPGRSELITGSSDGTVRAWRYP